MQFIAVDTTNFLLHFYQKHMGHGRMEHLWKARVAVGRPEYPTPHGVLSIASKAENPDWRMPNSDWVPEELRGKVIEGGLPENPLKAAFLDLGFLGVGIHGTADLDSLGSEASHGCIRVDPHIAVRLYRKAAVGTLVHIY